MAMCAAHGRLNGAALTTLKARLDTVPDRLTSTAERVAPIAATLAEELAD
jgi:hypothetical protein